MADPYDEDCFPNDFDGLDFDNIPGLQAPTAGGHTPVASASRSTLPPVASPAPSPESDTVEEMDPSFLAEVDALEARALSKISRGSQPLSSTELDDLPADAKSALSWQLIDGSLSSDHILNTTRLSPRWYVCSIIKEHALWSFVRIYGPVTASVYPKRSTELPSINSKGKGKAESQGDISIRAALAGYEDELTCPICCDLLVGAQVTNPCGHTCCGVCLHEWLQRNKYEPTCAVCRSRLSTRTPLLPNFSVDSLVHQHLQTLAKSGRPEWQEKGYKTIEWNKRLASWKKQTAARAAKEKLKESARPRRRRTRHYDAADYFYSIDESMDNEDAIVVHVSPRRGSRTRH